MVVIDPLEHDAAVFVALNATIRAGIRIVPTVRSWREDAPEDAESSLWLGWLRCDDPSRHLEAALELDASRDESRKTLVKWILEDIEVNQHELPAFYITDSRDDLKSLDRAALLTTGSEDGAWIEATRPAISRLRARAEEWLEAHPREGDFAVSGNKPGAGGLRRQCTEKQFAFCDYGVRQR